MFSSSLDGHHILIATGGEDNAVSAALIKIQKDNTINPIGKPYIIPNAHASSVTGLKYIDNVVFTTSTDQRLNMWKIDDLEEQGVSLTMIDAAYMDVPDPNALDAVTFK